MEREAVIKQEKARLQPVYFQFNTPASPTDINMPYIIGLHLTQVLGEKETMIFLADPLVSSVAGIIPTSQRVNVNRYFMNLLMLFRSKVTVNVVDVSQYLVNDGDIEDWFKLFSEFVLPFIKVHKVFNVVYKY